MNSLSTRRKQRSLSLNDLHQVASVKGEQLCDSFNCIINIKSSFGSQMLSESGLLELHEGLRADSGLLDCCSPELELFEMVREKMDPRKIASLSLSLMLVAILEALHTLTVYFSDNFKHSYL